MQSTAIPHHCLSIQEGKSFYGATPNTY